MLVVPFIGRLRFTLEGYCIDISSKFIFMNAYQILENS